MESIEKLREFIGDQFVSSGQAYLHGMAIAGSIEREIAERYMLLPVDADGVPIHVGDLIEYRCIEGTSRLHAQGVYVYREGRCEGKKCVMNERLGIWFPELCYHVKPDPLKELLHDACMNATRICCEQGVGMNVHVEIDETGLAEYAERIRELMEVD